MLVPKLFTTLAGYDRRRATADVVAGVIVGIVALPLSIAFAVASGLPPSYGLYTGIVAGFIISVLGGSRVQIGGPTGAFVVIVYGIVQTHGVDGLVLATMMAGIILILLGVARLGAAIKFIPYPVTAGFTAGIAVIIFTSQVPDLLGLELTDLPADFFGKWSAIAASSETVRPVALLVAAVSLTIIVLWPRVTRRVPGSIIALLVAVALVQLLGLEVETIGSRFGEIQASFPRPTLPDIDLSTLTSLLAPALAIALLGGIESLLSAVIADGMIGGRHRSNMELIAQGVANVVAPIFGGMPATGAIARTATNVRNGGRTPIAGIVHAVTLLAITLFLGRWVAWIPMPALAAILVVVSYHMSEWRSFRSEVTSAPRSDTLVMLTTFGLTVAVDLVIAIQVGMVLAAFLFMRRMAEVANVSVISSEFRDDDANGSEARAALPAGVQIYEINGPFFFGAAEKFKETVASIGRSPRVLILRMRNVPAIDSTAMHALRALVRRAGGEGTRIVVSDIQPQPLLALTRAGLLDEIGADNCFTNVDEAIGRAREYVSGEGPRHAVAQG